MDVLKIFLLEHTLNEITPTQCIDIMNMVNETRPKYVYTVTCLKARRNVNRTNPYLLPSQHLLLSLKHK